MEAQETKPKETTMNSNDEQSQTAATASIVQNRHVRLDFGEYVRIEQKRFGVENEMFLYKVIGGGIKSNCWVTVPVGPPNFETEAQHDEIEEVVKCVCCGVDETKVVKFRVCDVTKSNHDISFV
jgi:hypothetical protein